MDNRSKQIYNWLVKQGSVSLHSDNDQIHLEINTENNPSCLLTQQDAEEIVSILSDLAGDIWDNPHYTREPYTGKFYALDEKGRAYWDISETKLFIGLSEEQDSVEISIIGNPAMKISVNAAVEIVQLMTHFANKL